MEIGHKWSWKVLEMHMKRSWKVPKNHFYYSVCTPFLKEYLSNEFNAWATH